MKKTELMGVRISDLTARECLSKATGYLKKGGLNVIYYVSRDMLLTAKDAPELKNLIDQADMVLPDSADILNACGILNRGREKEIERNLFFKGFLKVLEREKSRIFIVSDSSEKAVALEGSLGLIQEGLKEEGHYIAKDGEDPENIVNEINSVVPDVIFVNLASPEQEKFIIQKKKINAKVMVLVTPDMLNVREDGTIDNRGFLNLLTTRIFKRQAKKYEMDKEC
ncbi:MAG: WecB/TagA/CpsF family glycosyltransferase [Lachnospiraceae bacterium]|nr:WecB/TagA/CpsF family glycosyltransferase [Lachnospiraceae bacterium]